MTGGLPGEPGEPGEPVDVPGELGGVVPLPLLPQHGATTFSLTWG